MKDAEIRDRLNVKVDILGLSLDQNRIVKWAVGQLVPEVQKLLKEEEKKQ